MTHNYFGKKILILGIGLTGISCLYFFLKKGIKPRIMDESQHPIYLNRVPRDIKYSLGILKKTWILESDLIIISPGIPLFKPILIQARLLGINIISDIELFSREAKFPIISITGTNGKSTVATMVKKIAKESGYNVVLGGNIGYPVLNMLNQLANLYIIELSSFQLESTFTLKSKISVVLNISEDHSNRYPSGFQQYKKVKLSIYNKSEICVINSNEKLNIAIKKFQKCITFGSNISDYYILKEDKNSFLCHKEKRIIHTKKTLLNGFHNYTNALVALAISDQMKFPRKHAIKVLNNFLNLPHRLQNIRYYRGVTWINDSKSTNVNSTKAALDTLKTQGTIWLLLGGDSKFANFNILKNDFNKLKIKIYCFGKDRVYLSKICENKSVCIDNLIEAVKSIEKKVVSGDVVLLSPGCSSLDQFSNFQERGNFFIKLVKEIN